jgi:hypothetical protein
VRKLDFLKYLFRFFSKLLGNRKTTPPKITTKKPNKKCGVHSITQDCAEIDLDLKIVVLTLCWKKNPLSSTTFDKIQNPVDMHWL